MITLRMGLIFVITALLLSAEAQELRLGDKTLDLRHLAPLSVRVINSREATLIKPSLLYSCQHVNYSLMRAETLIRQMVESIRYRGPIQWEELDNNLKSSQTFRKNILATRQYYFYNHVYSLEMKLPQLTETEIFVFNNFSFNYTRLNQPNDSNIEYFNRNGQSVVKVKLSYLDVCTGDQLILLPVHCGDMSNMNCRPQKMLSLDLTELRKHWDLHFWGGEDL